MVIRMGSKPDPNPKPSGRNWSPSRTLFAASLAVAALLVWRFFSPSSVPALVELVDDDVKRLWNYRYLEFGRLAITPAFLTKSFLFVLLLVLLSRAVRHSLESRLMSSATVEQGRGYAFARVVSYAVFVLN